MAVLRGVTASLVCTGSRDHILHDNLYIPWQFTMSLLLHNDHRHQGTGRILASLPGP
jgi:hypothetical protein